MIGCRIYNYENVIMKSLSFYGGYMTSIKDVAQRAGVSITTVSRVINGNAPVHERTRAAVTEAMEALGYVPDRIAQGMRTKRTNTIAMVIPEYKNAFYHELLQYIEGAASQRGYKLLVTSVSEAAGIHPVRELISRRVDGLFLCTYLGDADAVAQLMALSQRNPMVFLDNLQDAHPVNGVYTDGYRGLSDITRHLQTLGHTRIAFLGGLKQYHVACDRRLGYVSAMEEMGLPIYPGWDREGDYSAESGYRAAQYLLTECPQRPTAIAAASDLMAMGAMNYCLSHQIHVPKDLAVAGFDDILASRLIVPALTTVTQPMEALASKAVDLLCSHILQPSSAPEKLVLTGQLQIRGSTDPRKISTVPIVV